ncbi:MAG: PorT family protein [Bacteroidia bacterium]|nr:PorT family protein [Bacteroidia bacterium]
MKTFRIPFAFCWLFFFGAPQLTAQDNSSWRIGFRIEPMISWTKSDSKNLNTGTAKPDFSFGVIVDRSLSQKLSLNGGVSMAYLNPTFTIKNAFLKTPATGSSISPITNSVLSYNLRSLDFNLVLQSFTQPHNGIRYMGEVGLLSGFLIRSKFDFNSDKFDVENGDAGSPEAQDKIELFEDINGGTPLQYDVNTLRFQGILGLGLKKRVMEDSDIQASLRYNFALRSFADESKWKINHNYISLQLGFIF